MAPFQSHAIKKRKKIGQYRNSSMNWSEGSTGVDQPCDGAGYLCPSSGRREEGGSEGGKIRRSHEVGEKG